jgi:DNA gyrase/topoisomerase IV subunit A
MVLRVSVADIPQSGRATRGAKVMQLEKGDEAISVAVVSGEQRAVLEGKGDVG